jgi:hypothetical protein
VVLIGRRSCRRSSAGRWWASVTSTEKGRRRQQALFDLLGQYQAATTDQLADLLWGGDQRLARGHLLRFVRDGRLRRYPHPLYRHGPYVYTRSDRKSGHSQKILHHLMAMDFHLAVTHHLGKFGARVIPELPWGPGSVPDQTVLWKETVWAVEHHLTGEFRHGPDYRRFMEEEQFETCHWWREGIRIGLLVVTQAGHLEHVKGLLRRNAPPGLTVRVALRENVLRDPGPYLKLQAGTSERPGQPG